MVVGSCQLGVMGWVLFFLCVKLFNLLVNVFGQFCIAMICYP